MWEVVKEYAKPVGIVILGFFGAKLIEKGASSLLSAGQNAVTSIGNIAQGQVAQANTAPPAQANTAPAPANAAEVNK